MATTTSSTGNFAAARYAALIKKDLLETVESEYGYRFATEVSELNGAKGYSNQFTVNRNRRIAIPVSSATEGTAPTPTTLEIDQVSGTADQYVMSVKFTDVMEIYAFHDVLAQATEAIKDAMKRLDELVCFTAFGAATNVLYPTGTTTRVGLTSSTVLDSDTVARAVTALRRGSNIYGPAKPWKNGQYLGLIPDYCIQDLQKDASWLAAETRAQKADLLEKGIISDWKGVYWKRITYHPEYVGMTTGMTTPTGPTITEATAVTTSTSTASLNGFKITTVATGGTFADATAYDFKVVARHKLRGFAENISTVLNYTTAAGASNDSSLSVVAPTSTDYWYDIYQGADGGTLYRVLQNVEGAAVNVLTTPATTGTAAPSHGAYNVMVLPVFIVGKGAVKSADLRTLETFLTPRASTPDDPAVQNRTASAKVFEGAFLQQNEWIRKIEVGTGFGT